MALALVIGFNGHDGTAPMLSAVLRPLKRTMIFTDSTFSRMKPIITHHIGVSVSFTGALRGRNDCELTGNGEQMTEDEKSYAVNGSWDAAKPESSHCLAAMTMTQLFNFFKLSVKTVLQTLLTFKYAAHVDKHSFFVAGDCQSFLSSPPLSICPACQH